MQKAAYIRDFTVCALAAIKIVCKELSDCNKIENLVIVVLL